MVSSKGSGGGGGASKEEIMDGIAQTMQDKTPKMFEIDLVETRPRSDHVLAGLKAGETVCRSLGAKRALPSL